MGDAADDLLDSMWNSDEDFFSFRRPRRSAPTIASCPCCHEAVTYNVRGQKMSGGVLHRCPITGDRPRLDCT